MTAEQRYQRQFGRLTLWFFGFVTGAAAGSLGTLLLAHLRGGKRNLPDLINARQRILAGIKRQHEHEIRREIFQTTEALRAELEKSLRRLVSLTERVLEHVHEEATSKNDQERGAPRTDPTGVPARSVQTGRRSDLG